MPRFERMPLHKESDRAPRGVCELSIQSSIENAEDYGKVLQNRLSNYVEKGFRVKVFRYEQETDEQRLVIYTGTDRLDIATLRDIAEVYGQVTQFTDGNIPPELSLVPTSDGNGAENYFAWFEFKLQMELPKEEVEMQLRKNVGKTEIVGKNPVGENMEAIVYRDGNKANHQVREILKMANQVRDALPINYIRLVCEPKK